MCQHLLVNDHPPATPEPDGKDWTWVLDRPCLECGFDASAVDRDHITGRLLATTARWQAALRRPDVAVRPDPQTWSVLEYGAHIRDVHRIFGERARLIQEQDDPGFANWDQDATALEQRYWQLSPGEVADGIEWAAAGAAAAFAGLAPDRWDRTGRRSNGSFFTMQTLGLYYLHDVEHHLHDVNG